MSYAIISLGGKQYRVHEGEIARAFAQATDDEPSVVGSTIPIRGEMRSYRGADRALRRRQPAHDRAGHHGTYAFRGAAARQ